MRIFLGLSKTDYQDIFRSIGSYIDEHKLTNIRLIETENGLLLQGTPVRDDNSREAQNVPPQTYLLTMNDIEQMLRRSYARRGTVPEFNRINR